jgi:chromate transporter
MMNLWELFKAFFISNLLGYGGGPASIPLMQVEIVNHYGWMTNSEFANILAVGNALPGPIATKIAAFVGYDIGGSPGFIVALFATVAPSAIALIVFLKLLDRYRTSSVVKGMTLLIQPVIAVMMILLTWEIGAESVDAAGILQFLGIAIVSFFALTKWKVHPALIIIASFIYGSVFMSGSIPFFS